MFCHSHGNKIVLLLAGYDKGRDPSEKRQQKEITRVRKCLTAWQEAKKREVARRRKGCAVPRVGQQVDGVCYRTHTGREETQ